MTTDLQLLGDFGEKFVIKHIKCPSCKRDKRSLKQLRTNFICADIICDFCGYLAQVKTKTMKSTNEPPRVIAGAGWNVQKERLDAGIYYPLFIVGFSPESRSNAIWYVPADLQTPAMFVKQKKLPNRKNYSMFNINVTEATCPPILLKRVPISRSKKLL